MISANLVFRVIVYVVSPSIGLSTTRCCWLAQHHRRGRSSESSLVKRQRHKGDETRFVQYNSSIVSKTDVGELPMKKKNRQALDRVPQELSRRMSRGSIKSSQSDKENTIVG